jgi:hypothetical protein
MSDVRSPKCGQDRDPPRAADCIPIDDELWRVRVCPDYPTASFGGRRYKIVIDWNRREFRIAGCLSIDEAVPIMGRAVSQVAQELARFRREEAAAAAAAEEEEEESAPRVRPRRAVPRWFRAVARKAVSRW